MSTICTSLQAQQIRTSDEEPVVVLQQQRPVTRVDGGRDRGWLDGVIGLSRGLVVLCSHCQLPIYLGEKKINILVEAILTRNGVVVEIREGRISLARYNSRLGKNPELQKFLLLRRDLWGN